MTWTLDMEAVFGYAENVLNSMMPMVYVTAGLSLGFIVVSKIISAFR
jgi:hypothetical protein